jgi:hypothetical protein
MNDPGHIYQLKEAQTTFYGYIRSCVELFWHKKTESGRYGPRGSSESWNEEITMSHEEAIQKIKEDVIPCLAKAKSILDRNENYVRIYRDTFENLCVYIEDFFTVKRQQRVRDLLKELWDLLVKSNDSLSL